MSVEFAWIMAKVSHFRNKIYSSLRTSIMHFSYIRLMWDLKSFGDE